MTSTNTTLKNTLSALLCQFCLVSTCFALGQVQYVQTEPAKDCFPLADKGQLASLYVDSNDFPGVIRAASDLLADINRVTGLVPKITNNITGLEKNAVIIGSIEKSPVVRQLVRDGKIDVNQITGKWESFLIEIVAKPLPDVESALVIAGSDKRGTIYGIYDLSEQIGVSPWYWWADVPVEHKESLFVKSGKFIQGPPAVRYRGIFLNDEAPALTNWVRGKFKNYNHEFYVNVFELLLRLKANYLWPAMWNNAFNEDDVNNPRLADEYGIVMGTSHQEPMLRAQKEWDRRYMSKLGSWNYYKNPDVLENFWREGIRRNKNYESIITMGLRGADDTPMIPNGTVAESMALLEKIVGVQRKMIAEEVNPDVTKVPQLWCLYKEVQEYYEKGLRVPDDVTLLWSDDNWGNLRRLPTEDERKRPGGAGIYYHFDYVGGPRSYKWLNTIQIAKIWEQMNLAYNYGATRIWIVNVGDLKPMEFPIDFFMNFAWDPQKWPKEQMAEYGKLWAQREFGPKYAGDIADIMSKYTKYNARRKPELLEPNTFSLVNYNEADRVVADWNAITAKAEQIYEKLPANAKDAFFQLVLYPTKASAIVTELYVTVGKNRLYAEQKRAGTNELAAKARALFQADADLANYYNKTMANGKWNHMMDQTHIGYTSWNQPSRNVMPEVKEINAPFVEPNSAPAVEADSYISIEAEHYTKKIDTDSARWEKIDDYGRTLSSMTIFPVTAKSVTPPPLGDALRQTNSPCLEYKMDLSHSGPIEVEAIFAPTLNFVPGRGLRYAISFDDEAPKIIDILPANYDARNGNADWEQSVKGSARKIKTTYMIPQPGCHTLKIWMVDPGVVLQKIVIYDTGSLKPSYLAPPESIPNCKI